MRVFKPTRKANGKTVKYRYWYIEFRDQHEALRRLPAYTDKSDSEEAGRRIEKVVVLKINQEPLSRELDKWVDTLPTRLREGLAKLELIDAHRTAARKPLTAHVEDFYTALLAKGSCEKHSKSLKMKALSVIEGCGFKTWSDVKTSEVERYLKKLREVKKRSNQTSNFYAQAMMQFARWMVDRAAGRLIHSRVRSSCKTLQRTAATIGEPCQTRRWSRC